MPWPIISICPFYGRGSFTSKLASKFMKKFSKNLTLAWHDGRCWEMSWRSLEDVEWCQVMLCMHWVLIVKCLSAYIYRSSYVSVHGCLRGGGSVSAPACSMRQVQSSPRTDYGKMTMVTNNSQPADEPTIGDAKQRRPNAEVHNDPARFVICRA